MVHFVFLIVAFLAGSLFGALLMAICALHKGEDKEDL